MNSNYSGDTWTIKGSVTNHNLSQYKTTFMYTPQGAPDSRGGFNKIRITFSNWNSDIFRIAAIGVINFNSRGLRETFLAKDGGTLYGDLLPHTDSAYYLGTNSNKWKEVWATTVHGYLSGNADTATKATQDSAGQQINATYIKGLSVSGKTITYTKGDGTTGTITTQDNNTTYTAGTGLSLSGTTFNHKNSVTAATAQGDASKTLTFGGTFTIPTITYDAQGHITGKGTTTMTMPENPNSDTKVTQTVTTSNAAYPLLLAPSGQTANTTTTSYFDSSVTLNPSTNTITANVSGNANSASKVNNKLTVGSKTFDGSAAVTIAASDLGLASAMLFLGTTTTAITDGATTNPVTIGGANKTVTAGNVVLYGNKEFAWTGSAWEELGNEGSYKIVQAAVADPSASGTSNTFIATISQDANGKITATKKTVAVTNNAPTLSWGTTSTIGSVAGTNLQVKMPANPNTDTKVTQTVTTSNAAYPLLLAPNGQTSTATTTSYFDSGVTLNPSTNTITANISGNAATATKATQDGSGNTITSKYITVDTSQTISGSKTFTSATNMNKLAIITSLQEHSSPIQQCLVINSSGLTDTITAVTDKNSPGIGFHIGNVSWGSLIFNNAGFKFINSDATGYMNVTAAKFIGALQGNADTATKLATARTIALTGSITGSGTFDGSGNLSITTTTNHTHNYAGSSSAGGSANSAVKLDTTAAGSTTQPVYFTDGKPKAISYTIAKSVPSNAVFTDINVRQKLYSSNYNLPLLMSYQTNTNTTAEVDNVTFRNNNIYANPSTGMVAATSYKISEHVNLQYDSTNECLNFVFT